MKKAFSLIELLISLIVISLIIAAFTPVLSKKLKHREIALGGGGKIETKCSERFNEKCMICSNTECILCTNSFSCSLGQYCDEADDCKCKSCSAKFSHCAKCTKNYCESCTVGYEFNSGSCSEKTCPQGYYLSGSNCLPCLGETIQPNNNSRATSCSSCPTGQKANSSHTKCETPALTCESPCKTCSQSSTNCTSCIDGYEYRNGVCVRLTDAPCVNIGNICVAKFNAGDAGGLSIEGIVEIKATVASGAARGGQTSRLICWRGENTSNCNANNGGYNGCNRTICTWYAAKAICEYHGWRLPTISEAPSFYNYSKDKGVNGLQLCDGASGTYSALCKNAYRCPDSFNGLCDPYHIWSERLSNDTLGAYDFFLNAGSWSRRQGPVSFAFSVRCVKDL